MPAPSEQSPMSCDVCGEPHVTSHGKPSCTGHKKKARGGGPCTQPPMKGQRVCRSHGAKTSRSLAAAERRLQERSALLALESFGIPVVVDPHTALLEELHRTAGAVAWLGAIVAGLDREDVAWGTSKVKTGGDDAGRTEEAKPNIWYELWARERKHLVDVAAACVKAGIEERRIQLAEAQGAMLAGVISRVLDRLELSEVQRQLVASVVPEELRAIAASGDAA